MTDFRMGSEDTESVAEFLQHVARELSPALDDEVVSDFAEIVSGFRR